MVTVKVKGWGINVRECPDMDSKPLKMFLDCACFTGFSGKRQNLKRKLHKETDGGGSGHKRQKKGEKMLKQIKTVLQF